ncbi:O-antigen ligase family protein [Sphingomonas sp.]|jgi:O-antigen ligase|uniref:O-antigen ligase family protein n=1 Tax=Sphingomonas sp. TaxID=28214 RepID=UPI002ED90207
MAAALTLSFLLLLLMLWPKYLSFDIGPTRIGPYHFAVLAALGMVGVMHLRTQRFFRGDDLIALVAILAFLAFWFVRLLASSIGLDPGRSVYLVLREALMSGSVFLFALSLGKATDPLRLFTRMMGIAIPIMLMAALIEMRQQRTLPDLIFSVLPIQIDAEFWLDLTLDKIRDGGFRAQSLFTHPIMYGVVMAGLMPLCAAMTLNARGYAKTLPLMLGLCCVIGVWLSGARSGQLAALMGLGAFGAILLAMNRNTVKFFAVALPFAGLAGIFLYQYVLALIVGRTSNEQLSSYVRGIMWDYGWPAFLRRPILGHGDGLSLDLAGLKTGYGIRTIDDYYLTLLLDSGIVGLVLAALFVGTIVIAALTYRASPKEQRLVAGLASGVVAIAIAQKANSLQEAVTYIYLFGGLILAARARASLAARRARRTPVQYAVSQGPLAAAR